MATLTTEGFSVSHAAILDGTTGLEEDFGDIYGISEGSLELATDSFDNTGDDTVLSTWYWMNYANVSIKAGYVPFQTLSLLYGVDITSTGSAPNDTYSVPLWNETSQNQPRRPMLIRVPAKDSEGTPRVLDFILYNVQFQPFSFDGPTYKDGLKLNYVGRALLSTVDEEGTTLSERAIGRLVSTPQA
jgi:hypothetical protein